MAHCLEDIDLTTDVENSGSSGASPKPEDESVGTLGSEEVRLDAGPSSFETSSEVPALDAIVYGEDSVHSNMRILETTKNAAVRVEELLGEAVAKLKGCIEQHAKRFQNTIISGSSRPLVQVASSIMKELVKDALVISADLYIAAFLEGITLKPKKTPFIKLEYISRDVSAIDDQKTHRPISQSGDPSSSNDRYLNDVPVTHEMPSNDQSKDGNLLISGASIPWNSIFETHEKILRRIPNETKESSTQTLESLPPGDEERFSSGTGRTRTHSLP